MGNTYLQAQLQVSQRYKLINMCTIKLLLLLYIGDFLICSIKTQKIIRAISATKTGIGSLLWYSDGLILGCGDNTIKYFNHQMSQVSETRVDGRVLKLSYLPDSPYVSTAAYITYALYTHAHFIYSYTNCYHMPLKQLLASTGSGSLIRVDIHTKQSVTLSESHTGGITAVSYSPVRKDRLATSSVDGSIRVWDLIEYTVVAVCRALRDQDKEARPTCLVYTDSQQLLSGWSDGR